MTDASPSATTTICPDHHVCRNGSVCTAVGSSYICDCTPTAAATGQVYAGLSCDHVATSFCNADNAPNEQSFCTNHGACVRQVDETGMHYGCQCPTGYTGDFCELIQGQGVPDYLAAPARQSSSSDRGSAALVGSLVAAVAVLLLAAVAVYVVLKRRRNGETHTTLSPKSIRQADSTQLEADGQVLRNSMHQTLSSSSQANKKAGSPAASLSTRPSTSLDATEGDGVMVEIDENGV